MFILHSATIKNDDRSLHTPDEDQCDTPETHQVRSSKLCGHNCPGMKETTFVDHLDA